MNIRCHCGESLHYKNDFLYSMMIDITMKMGEFIDVTVDGKTWKVQRHYIALHGLKGCDIDKLGFEEIRE